MVTKCHRPPRDCCTCPLKAGHTGTISLISHVIPNFLMLVDALTNTYLGLHKSKDGDEADPIPFFFKYIIFFIEVG